MEQMYKKWKQLAVLEYIPYIGLYILIAFTRKVRDVCFFFCGLSFQFSDMHFPEAIKEKHITLFLQ